MTYPLTIAASAMRDINRSAILEIIRRESPISRTAIAETLGCQPAHRYADRRRFGR